MFFACGKSMKILKFSKESKSWPLCFVFLTIFLFLFISHILILALKSPTERNDQRTWIMSVNPLLDLHQPTKEKTANVLHQGSQTQINRRWKPVLHRGPAELLQHKCLYNHEFGLHTVIATVVLIDSSLHYIPSILLYKCTGVMTPETVLLDNRNSSSSRKPCLERKGRSKNENSDHFLALMSYITKYYKRKWVSKW